jgi:hypothetical protein
VYLGWGNGGDVVLSMTHNDGTVGDWVEVIFCDVSAHLVRSANTFTQLQ